jgi:quinol-cytochrome oxidoreductase complex cytochrome b subunit
VSSKDPIDAIWRWIEERTGLRRLVLRPQPEFTLFNPHYWLGALAVISFVVQGFTGFFLMMYYVPQYVTTPFGAQNTAWQSVNYIITKVPYGALIASMHLYGAYAMIAIAFLHLLRNYYVGAYKKPRELMWILGMILGIITLLYAFTGYLLPMNVVSYGASSVGVQLASYLPGPIGRVLPELLKGTVFPDNTLNRFFAIHVVLLPILLLLVLGAKIGLVFEAHGAHGPVEISPKRGPRSRKVNWYPRLILYSMNLALFYLAILLIISALFPISAGTEYTGGPLGANILPDWYFVWTDIVLRASFFSGKYVVDGILAMLGVIVVIILLPFIDRSPTYHAAQRPLLTILWTAMVGELFGLTAYGYLTPSAQPVSTPIDIFVVYIAVPLVVIILGLVIYRFSPAYILNSGRLWGVKPAYTYKQYLEEVRGSEVLVKTNALDQESITDQESVKKIDGLTHPKKNQ